MFMDDAFPLQVNKAPALTKAQAIKFANYFISRKSVHQVRKNDAATIGPKLTWQTRAKK